MRKIIAHPSCMAVLPLYWHRTGLFIIAKCHTKAAYVIGVQQTWTEKGKKRNDFGRGKPYYSSPLADSFKADRDLQERRPFPYVTALQDLA